MQTRPTHPIDEGVDPDELDRHITVMYATGVDITPEQLAKARRLAREAELCAACIAGASQQDLYLADIAAAGLDVQIVQRNPSYRFTSERAKRTGEKYGASSISLLALHPNPTTTQEVSK